MTATPTFPQTIWALIEKGAASYLEAFLTLLLVHPLGASAAQAAAIAAIPAALTVIANGLPSIPPGLTFAADLFWRVVRTYAVSFLGYLIALPVFHLDYSVAVAAGAAALTAALAVLKAGIASKVGNPASAALLPRRWDLAG